MKSIGFSGYHKVFRKILFPQDLHVFVKKLKFQVFELTLECHVDLLIECVSEDEKSLFKTYLKLLLIYNYQNFSQNFSFSSLFKITIKVITSNYVFKYKDNMILDTITRYVNVIKLVN